MKKQYMVGHIFTTLVVLILGCDSGSNSVAGPDGDDEWVTVSGRVIYEEQPISAMILVNGQHVFTKQGKDGVFELDAPLDQAGMLTLSVFASGLAPFEQKIEPPDTTNLIVSMTQSSPDSPKIEIMAELVFTDDNRMEIRGNLSSEGLPLGGTVIANGQYAVSDQIDGSFEMTVPPTEESETVTLMCFAQDYQPYSVTIPPLYATVEALATSYGTVKITGIIETLVFKTVCDEWTGKGCISYYDRVPAGATVDANGMQTTTSLEDGRFELEASVDATQSINLSYSTIEGIHFTTIISQEDIVPWTYLSVTQTAISMLTETTEIAHIVGGKAPYTIHSTNASITSATSLGRLITIAGLSAGSATIVITDSESYTATIDVTVSSEGTDAAVWVPVRSAYDRNDDGYVDTYIYYTYSAYGLLREDTDYNHDGTMDHTIYYTYGVNGRDCTVSNEYSNSGDLTGYQYRTYDEQGNLTSTEDALSILHYVHNDQGRIIAFEIDHGKDGVIDYAVYTTYDSHGNRIKEESDEDNDGIVDFVSTYENAYDENGNLTQSKCDRSNDGTFDEAGYLFYNDGDASLASFQLDFTNDGIIDRTVYFGPDNRVDYVKHTSLIQSYDWEPRVFVEKLNIPDPFTHWVWDQF